MQSPALNACHLVPSRPEHGFLRVRGHRRPGGKKPAALGEEAPLKGSIARLLVATVAALSLPTTFGRRVRAGRALRRHAHLPRHRHPGRVHRQGRRPWRHDLHDPGVGAGHRDRECTNPGGNVASGQTFDTTTTGQSGPFSTPRNGQARFTMTTDTPAAPPGSCPNPMWTATVVDVAFGDATITSKRTRRSRTRSPFRSPNQPTTRPTQEQPPGPRGCSFLAGKAAEPSRPPPPAARVAAPLRSGTGCVVQARQTPRGLGRAGPPCVATRAGLRWSPKAARTAGPPGPRPRRWVNRAKRTAWRGRTTPPRGRVEYSLWPPVRSSRSARVGRHLPFLDLRTCSAGPVGAAAAVGLAALAALLALLVAAVGALGAAGDRPGAG
jgi:hypothetical protein